MLYAFLIETDPSSSLGGSCLRDLWNTATYLNTKYDNILIYVYTSRQIPENNLNNFPDKCIYSTTHNISQQIKNILNNVTIDDTVFTLISGHGYQTSDRNGDEKDHLDEYVMTIGGMLLDDDIHNIFISGDYKFVGLVDTCHSGTMLDLNNTWNGLDDINSKTYALGACLDSQLEACDVGQVGFGGALTVHMLDNDYLKLLIDGNIDEMKKVYAGICKILSALGQKPVLQYS